MPQTVYEWIDSWDETKSIPGRYLPILREAFEAGRQAANDATRSQSAHAVRPDEPDTPMLVRHLAAQSQDTAIGLQITQDRVLIRADREDKAPQRTAGGLYVAQSLAAAVDGTDSGESWFVGTIVQLGPLVRRLDVRDIVLDWLQELENVGHDISPAELRALRARIRALPQEHIDPLNVGDRVVFSWASGQQIAIDEDKYVVLRVDDILAVLEDA